MIVEICASNFESTLAALQGGADRIELCSELSVGGLTPSRGLLRKVMDEISIPVHILVRPRAGDFVYSEAEMNEMLETIAYCCSMGCHGIVSGTLTSEGTIDIPKMMLLKNASGSLHFTFHRAFDLCSNPTSAVNQLIKIGVDTILTSGRQTSAMDGLELLKTLKDQFKEEMTIMPGAGINDTNAIHFIQEGFEAIHLSAIRKDDFKSTSFLENVSGVSDFEMIRKVVAMAH